MRGGRGAGARWWGCHVTVLNDCHGCTLARPLKNGGWTGLQCHPRDIAPCYALMVQF